MLETALQGKEEGREALHEKVCGLEINYRSRDNKVRQLELLHKASHTTPQTGTATAQTVKTLN